MGEDSLLPEISRSKLPTALSPLKIQTYSEKTILTPFQPSTQPHNPATHHGSISASIARQRPHQGQR